MGEDLLAPSCRRDSHRTSAPHVTALRTASTEEFSASVDIALILPTIRIRRSDEDRARRAPRGCPFPRRPVCCARKEALAPQEPTTIHSSVEVPHPLEEPVAQPGEQLTFNK